MKKIIITGSSKGIGLITSKLLLEKGFHVIGLSRSKTPISHPNFTFCSVDLSQIRSLSDAFDSLVKKHPDITSLILNAGIGHFGYLEQLSAEKMQESLNVNFLSQALLCKSFMPQLKKNKSSNIIFIGSEAALQGSSAGSIYCASKFAIRGFYESIKKECSKSHVRVSMINPGMVRTHFHDKTYFEPGPDKEHAIEAIDVAQTILMILNSSPLISFDMINLSPLKKVVQFKENPKSSTQKDLLLNLGKKP